jgi:arginyl-tRNA synthetase
MRISSPAGSEAVLAWKKTAATLINKVADSAIAEQEIVFPENNFGDLALPCFKLAATLKKSPVAIAVDLADKINELVDKRSVIASAKAAGPYVNFFLNRKLITADILKLVGKQQSAYGVATKKRHKVLLEYVSPNTNKPYHLGHLRNAFIGWSLAKLLTNQGDKVIKSQIVNDRGIHIMKSLLAYAKWGQQETPESSGLKSDHLIGKYYVKFASEAKNNPELEDEALDYLRRWEAGDKELHALWKTMNGWAIAGQTTTAKRLGISFDRTDLESEIFEEGKKIALKALAQDLLRRRADGAIIIDLDEATASQGRSSERVILRPDGTSVYITQDLALAKIRFKEVKPDRLLYVVGNEQNYYFNVLFEVMARLQIVERAKQTHVTYNMVLLPEGRMKSREGTVVDADELLDELQKLAAAEIKSRQPDLAESEIRQRAEIVGLAAIKYYFLKVRTNSDIKFNPAESIAFIGDTGPYLLYTYARMRSIFRKAEQIKVSPISPAEISDQAWQLIILTAKYPNITKQAAEALDPSLIAEFAYNLARAVNDFYEVEQILSAEPALAAWRLEVLKAASQVLASSLDLIGIQTLEEM